ncbi:MAG: hypothetical protein FJ284_03245 [Planctomycetes bacterium]|nr:hypothetical protein [Planctomycetota bacterium]
MVGVEEAGPRFRVASAARRSRGLFAGPRTGRLVVGTDGQMRVTHMPTATRILVLLWPVVWPLLLGLTGVCGSTLAARARAAAADDVVATCADFPITRGEVETVMQRLGISGIPAGPQRVRAEAAVLEQLVDERVLRIELIGMGIRVADQEIEEAFGKLESQVTGRGGDFGKFLAATGRTPATLRDQLAFEIALDKFVRRQLTPEAVAAAFERNHRELDGTRLRVSQILLRSQVIGDGDPAARLMEQAREIRRLVVQGRLTFAEAAQKYSAGPSRRRGGDLGWIGRDEPMIDAFASQAYRLSKGTVSEPFVTPFGVHLITITAVEQGRIGIDAIRPRLEKLLAVQVVRSLVAAARQRIDVSFRPGVPHFDPATIGRSPEERAVVGAGDTGG